MNGTLEDARRFAAHLIEEHALPFLGARADDLIDLIRNKLGHTLVDLAENETASRLAFESIYEFLPAPVRLVVNRDTFIRYCLENKTKVLGQIESNVSSKPVAKL